jgi:hypothetical protein
LDASAKAGELIYQWNVVDVKKDLVAINLQNGQFMDIVPDDSSAAS